MFEKLLVLKGGRVEEDLHAPEAIGLDAKLCQVDKRHKPLSLWRRVLGNSFMLMYYTPFI
jgi:hypothetical protein